MNHQQLNILPIEENCKVTLANAHPEYHIHDSLRHGHLSVRSDLLNKHPLEYHLRNWDDTQKQLKKAINTRVFGTLPEFQPSIKRRFGASHLAHSRLKKDIMDGNDIDMDFESFLGTPKYSTVMLDPIAVMEHQY